MKPGTNSDVRTPLSISWPHFRGSIGEETMSETMARVVRRIVTLDIVDCSVVDVRLEGP